MKKLFTSVLLVSAIVSSSSVFGQAMQDFTHGVYVDNSAFAANPSAWSGKVVELRNIPFAGSKPAPTSVKTRSATVNSNAAVTNPSSPKTGTPVASTPAGPSGGTSNSTLPNCDAVVGYNTLPFAITSTYRPCLVMTNAVKKQLPAKSSKLILYVYCKNDGSLELMRVKRIN